MTALLDAALAYAARGWPVLPVQPGGKAPLTAHGVRDASVDANVIGRWLARVPDANLGIATGHPGPTVLDVDDLDRARDVLAHLAGTPAVATGRGRHLYFAGAPGPTRRLPYGELRGRGSYVVAPPSTHPAGTLYAWLLEPGDRLDPVPRSLAAAGVTAGCGDLQAPGDLVAYGQRHAHLVDFAVRLVRGGVVDRRQILVHLRAELAAFCEPLPPPAPRALEGIAQWAASTDIATRERNHR